MSLLIDADAIITALIYDEEHEETQEAKMSIADFLDSHTVEGCPQNGGWISVKDGLPEMYKAVLGYSPYHNNVWAVTMRENGEWYIWSPVSRRYDPDFEGPITHWMPMPEPPKEDKDDD